MRSDGASLFLDFLRVASLIDLAMRRLADADGLNETDVWILMALAGHLTPIGRPTPETLGASQIAEFLGFGRERVTVRVKGLMSRKLVRQENKILGADRRRKTYSPTSSGRAAALRYFKELQSLEGWARIHGEIKRRDHTVDPQRVAYGICLSETWPRPLPVWFDRRRLPAHMDAGSAERAKKAKPTKR